MAERTDRQKAGDAAESLVCERLTDRGWRILARNAHFGRSELDIVAIDPGPPLRLVVVEVRWRRSREFGLAEETPACSRQVACPMATHCRACRWRWTWRSSSPARAAGLSCACTGTRSGADRGVRAGSDLPVKRLG